MEEKFLYYQNITTDELLEMRNEARSGKNKDYETSDEIRDFLKKYRNVVIEDKKGYFIATQKQHDKNN